ncbi:MAG: DegT/DnrJ/EryC1/StrS family aminotransferase [Calditrichaeota bacterium]|nr:DegT/DnrJ/EryC1/StrS family aminotransferase [Calditrichota bacterium]
MKVPFLDLKAQYQSIGEEVREAVQRVMEQTAFAGGPFVEQFEKEFAAFCGCEYALGVSSGTSALWLALKALNVGPGDEVITVPNSFIATAEAISFCGATPVFVDVDERTYTMDPALLEQAITKRTKAIIPVHLFGQMADMDPIMEVAREHGLYVVEDACQAHGAEYKGRKAGSLGDAGCFSFYPGKNLGAYGEAGAVVTNDRGLAERIRMLRDHGQAKKYYHRLLGWNDRMDGIQAAVLSVKLRYLPEWNKARRAHAATYQRLLSGNTALFVPYEAPYGQHVYHVYAIRTEQRDAMLEYLAKRDIACGIHYPVPIHLQEAYRFLRLGEGSYPVAERCARQFLSLPMYPELTHQQIEYVARAIELFVMKEALRYAIAV